MKEQKQNLILPISIIIAGILIAGAVMYSNTNKTTSTEKTEIINTEEVSLESFVIEQKDLILSAGHARGNDNAKITLIEFSDPECPYCARFHATMDQLFESYQKDGVLAWHYVHLFPFDSNPQAHPNARAQAEAAECAASIVDEEMFWTFLTNIFAAEEPRDMKQIAKDLGIDATAFNSCVENKTFAESVEEQHNLSYNTLGLRGTPHSLIILEDGTGYRINGAYPIDTVAITFEAALAGVDVRKIQEFLDMFQAQGTTEEAINAYVQAEFIPAITAAQEASNPTE